MHKKSQAKFIYYFSATFVVLFVFLYTLGFVPESIKEDQGESLRTIWDKSQGAAIREQLNKPVIAEAEEPTRIVIERIGVDAIVANPNTANLKTLDDYLLQGAVRYPGSGLIGYGNMFIFAHSTGFRVVQNQAFKAFNGLKDLVEGDIIKVYSGNQVYSYRVSSVRLVDSNAALVEFGGNKNMLTLSTCNSFGAKPNVM
jgi:LPXTG-site transpeptidase (sortase) family protein